MSNSLVTVLIDTYNHQVFIADAIESVFRQDFPASETEILVVDDGLQAVVGSAVQITGDQTAMAWCQGKKAAKVAP